MVYVIAHFPTYPMCCPGFSQWCQSEQFEDRQPTPFLGKYIALMMLQCSLLL